ncbi:VWA domain-containing protein [Sphaerisporangium aureirubrum]|uniref:VWA domain-containing protein n=1 Tax=Sphaerisporangium aureirubrum TaxID=1544736 RepID=A0ABW1NND0_9ACTN
MGRKLALPLIFAVALPLSAAPAAAAIPSPIQVQPIDVVILVDESGSLSESAVTAERAAAALLAVGEFSSKSRVEVVGFGSKNDSGQNALDVVCPLGPLATREDREAVVDCVRELHRRTPEEGNDTDHVAAIGRAVSTLRATGDRDRQKIVFLLTDGVLDVRRSPNYGDTPDARQNAARQYLDAHLREAAGAGIQIWPLGFGKADLGQLKSFAVGRPCNNLTGSRPQAQLIQREDQVFSAMVRVYSTARCAGSQVADPQVVDGPGGREYHLSIPEIATDASITVAKYNPRFRVTYIDPAGNVVPKTGNHDGSTFQVYGEDSPVEGLRIGLPRPGEWTVKVEAPEGVRPEKVVAAVTWQGAVRSTITLDEQNPEPGGQVVVRSRLQTRREVVVSPEARDALAFSVDMTGDGVPDTVHVRLQDDGTGPDRKAGDGEYAGVVAVPSTATGALRFVGVVDAVGVQGDKVPYETQIGRPGSRVRTVIDVPQQTVAPGEVVRGSVTVTNDTGKPITATLALDGLREGDRVQVRSPELRMPVGQTQRDVELVLADGSALGDIPGVLVLRDAADPAREYGRGFVKVTVAYPPSPVPWILGALIALAVIALLVLFTRARAGRIRGDVQELTLLLYRGDRETAQWRAPVGRNRRLEFVIRDPRDHPHFDRPGRGDQIYSVSRSSGGSGGLFLRTPEGDVRGMRPGVPEPVGDGLAVAVLDGRLTAPTGGPPPGGGHSSGSYSSPSTDPLL